MSSNFYEATAENPIILGDYHDTFNMVVGTKNTEIDWFDNPYISANVIELNQDWAPVISKEIKLRMCELSDLVKFMNESIAVYYPNSLCFEDPHKVKLFNSWFDSSY